MEFHFQTQRYIRPNHRTSWLHLDEEKHTTHSNLYGITVVYDINHDNGLVMARWSICNGDNFSKSVGVDIAKNSPNREFFFYENVQKHRGLTEALIMHLREKHGVRRWAGTFTQKLKLFRRASMDNKEILPEYY